MTDQTIHQPSENTQDPAQGQSAEGTMSEVDNAMPGEYITDDDIPRFLVEPGHIKFTWAKHGIIIHVNHFNNFRCHAELEVWYYNQATGHERLLLPATHVDLLSASSKQAIVRPLRSDYTLNWDWMLNCVAYKVVDLSRQSEPIEEIASQPGLSLEPDYLLKPLLYKGHPTVIYGDKGSTKSLLALILSYIVQLPYADNRLGLTTDKNTCFVLYLDYEDEKETFRKRWTAIQNGFKAIIPKDKFGKDDPRHKIPDDLELTICYKRMTARLADAAEGLRPEIIDRHIGLVVVDSLGPAARGNLNDPEPALEYNAALRTLGVTSVTLAHSSKDPNQKRKSIFGSVFFTNLARSTWECKAESYPADNEVIASLEETNANLAGKHGTFGFKYTFDNSTNTISVKGTELEGTTLAGAVPLTLRIKNLLGHGAKEANELTELLDANDSSIRSALHRLSKREIIIKVGDAWGLREK